MNLNQHTERVECAGQAARQAALETFARAANSCPDPNDAPASGSADTPTPSESSRDSGPLELSGQIAAALDNAKHTEDVRHCELLDALRTNSNQVERLARSMEIAAQAQLESTRLLSSLIPQVARQSEQPFEKPSHSKPPTPSSEAPPWKRRVTRAHPDSSL